jgi:DNA-binding NarL/FixJ family response regulator
VSARLPIRVVIIEDHNIVRFGLKVVLASYPDIVVVGEAPNREKAFEIAILEHPDVLLVDLQLGQVSALDFLAELLGACRARSIIVTGTTNEEDIRRAIRAGATGFVLKNENPEILAHAIRKVHGGKTWLSPQLGTRAVRRSAQRDPESDKIASLTAREKKIIELLVNELSSSQIAETLEISEATVRNHLSSIFSKLEVSSQIELVLYAQRHGLT